MSKAKVAGAVLGLAASIVAYWEGYVPYTYADPVGIPTACYGHTGPDVRYGQRYTRPECQRLLQGDLAEAYAHVTRCIRTPLKDYEAAALTSATFNAGPKIVCGSTLQKYANSGRMGMACAQLDRWVYSRGVRLWGLVNRRRAERAMCEGRA